MTSRGGSILLAAIFVALPRAQVGAPQTEITKWQDGKNAAIAITFDDSTINQFRIALPLMNERGLVATFFVITGQIQGSKNMPTFVGRPIMDILRESATVPTAESNVYERTSLIRYLAVVQRNPLAPQNIQATNFAAVDGVLEKVRATGETYAVGAVPYVPIRSEEAQSGRPRADEQGGLSWDEMRKVASQGHEIANHAVSHARMTILDEPNILYEVEKAREELRSQVGEKHTFSLESPYGIRDDHSRQVLISRFDLVRNWVHDMDAEYMDGYMRGNNTPPENSKKPYLEWERGPIGSTATPQEMRTWIDTSVKTGAWLVLVIHGINGLGYEPIPTPMATGYFDDIKAASDSGKLWVATYQDGAKYIRERMHAKIETKQTGDAIEVTVTHSLDPTKYDVPLTARTRVPMSWTSTQITQGGRIRAAAVQRDASGNFIQYRIAPNAGTARIVSAG